MRAIHGDVPLSSGSRKVGKTVLMAYLTQEVRELEKFADWRVIEAVEDVRAVHPARRTRRSAPASWPSGSGSPAAASRPGCGDLSGGERRRLQLLRLLLTEPNVLILDEPTNDLDIETLTSLEDVLDGWAGTLLVVSHDRYLLERICDRQVALLGDGAIRDLPGGVEQYLDLRAAAKRSVVAAAPAGRSGAGGTASAVRRARRRGARALGRRDPRGPQGAEPDRAAAVQADQRPRSGIHADMAAKATDHAVGAASSTASCAAIVDERETLEMEWLGGLAEIVG